MRDFLNPGFVQIVFGGGGDGGGGGGGDDSKPATSKPAKQPAPTRGPDDGSRGGGKTPGPSTAPSRPVSGPSVSSKAPTPRPSPAPSGGGDDSGPVSKPRATTPSGPAPTVSEKSSAPATPQPTPSTKSPAPIPSPAPAPAPSFTYQGPTLSGPGYDFDPTGVTVDPTTGFFAPAPIAPATTGPRMVDIDTSTTGYFGANYVPPVEPAPVVDYRDVVGPGPMIADTTPMVSYDFDPLINPTGAAPRPRGSDLGGQLAMSGINTLGMLARGVQSGAEALAPRSTATVGYGPGQVDPALARAAGYTGVDEIAYGEPNIVVQRAGEMADTMDRLAARTFSNLNPQTRANLTSDIITDEGINFGALGAQTLQGVVPLVTAAAPLAFGTGIAGVPMAASMLTGGALTMGETANQALRDVREYAAANNLTPEETAALEGQVLEYNAPAGAAVGAGGQLVFGAPVGGVGRRLALGAAEEAFQEGYAEPQASALATDLTLGTDTFGTQFDPNAAIVGGLLGGGANVAFSTPQGGAVGGPAPAQTPGVSAAPQAPTAPAAPTTPLTFGEIAIPGTDVVVNTTPVAPTVPVTQAPAFQAPAPLGSGGIFQPGMTQQGPIITPPPARPSTPAAPEAAPAAPTQPAAAPRPPMFEAVMGTGQGLTRFAVSNPEALSNVQEDTARIGEIRATPEGRPTNIVDPTTGESFNLGQLQPGQVRSGVRTVTLSDGTTVQVAHTVTPARDQANRAGFFNSNVVIPSDATPAEVNAAIQRSQQLFEQNYPNIVRDNVVAREQEGRQAAIIPEQAATAAETVGALSEIQAEVGRFGSLSMERAQEIADTYNLSMQEVANLAEQQMGVEVSQAEQPAPRIQLPTTPQPTGIATVTRDVATIPETKTTVEEEILDPERPVSTEVTPEEEGVIIDQAVSRDLTVPPTQPPTETVVETVSEPTTPTETRAGLFVNTADMPEPVLAERMDELTGDEGEDALGGEGEEEIDIQTEPDEDGECPPGYIRKIVDGVLVCVPEEEEVLEEEEEPEFECPAGYRKVQMANGAFTCVPELARPTVGPRTGEVSVAALEGYTPYRPGSQE